MAMASIYFQNIIGLAIGATHACLYRNSIIDLYLINFLQIKLEFKKYHHEKNVDRFPMGNRQR